MNIWKTTVAALAFFLTPLIFLSSQNTLSKVALASVQIDESCSGTIIEDPDPSDGIQTFVLTAKHCVEPDKIGTIYRVYIPKNHSEEFDYVNERFMLVAKSSVSDLALLQSLKSGDMGTPKIDIYHGYPKFGSLVYNVSYAMALPPQITSGYLGLLEYAPFGDVSISSIFRRASVMTAPGSSGSALVMYDRGDYKIIGVLTGGVRGGSTIWYTSFWTPTYEIVDFIDSLKGN